MVVRTGLIDRYTAEYWVQGNERQTKEYWDSPVNIKHIIITIINIVLAMLFSTLLKFDLV